MKLVTIPPMLLIMCVLKPDARAEVEDTAAALELSPQEQIIVSRLRTLIGQAGNRTSGQERQSQVARSLGAVDLARANAGSRPGIQMELDLLKIKAHLAQADTQSAAQVADGLLGEFVQRFGDDRLNHWLPRRVERLYNVREFDLAVMLLRASIVRKPDAAEAAQRDLQIGDFLAHKAHPDGPYNEALTHYDKVAARYRGRFPDLADDADLRRAKLLWRAADTAAARSLFQELAGRANPVVAEEARHYPDLMEMQERELREHQNGNERHDGASSVPPSDRSDPRPGENQP